MWLARSCCSEVFSYDQQLHKVEDNECDLAFVLLINVYCVSLAVMKVDILDTFDEVKVAVGYKLAGKVLPSFPGQPTSNFVLICLIC